uniref:Uncharacterized protein n=1 Tax=Anopheles epiroticus TaxID=199890 RepID=A0A182PCI7_9DIPT
MIYLMVAGVILFAYLFLYDWWTNGGYRSSAQPTVVARGALQEATELTATKAREKQGEACDASTADGCDTEPPIGVLTNGNSSAPEQPIVADAAVEQLAQQLKQHVSVSNANFLYGPSQPRRHSQQLQQKQKRSNRPQDRPCLVNGQQERCVESESVDTNDNHIKMESANDTVPPAGEEPSSTGQERASFIVGEEDSQLDDELEANDAFPQTMENGGLRSVSSYEMNLSEKRRRLR